MALIQINKDPSRRELRLFAALWFPLFVAGIGLLSLKLTDGWEGARIVWGSGVVLAVAMLAAPALARVVFLGLSYATFPIGFVVSYVVLGVVYFGVLTPLGLVLRALGRDSMRLRRDPSATTYWHERHAERPAADYFNQF
jgi:hypothetical protein